MSAIIGTALVAASLAGFAWATLVFRNPAGSAWREKYLVLEGLACLIVGAFFFGIALQFAFALQFDPPLSWAFCAGVVVLLWAMFAVIWRTMGVRAKVARFEAARAETRPAPRAPSGGVEQLRRVG